MLDVSTIEQVKFLSDLDKYTEQILKITKDSLLKFETAINNEFDNEINNLNTNPPLYNSKNIVFIIKEENLQNYIETY